MQTLGPFTILSRLAVGGMGVVYLAEHDDGSSAVVKLLDLPEEWDDVPVRLFVQEVQATARLHHDNVIAIFDYGLLPDDVTVEKFGPQTPYYVMEYIEQGSLEHHPPRSWEQLQLVLDSTLAGLAHAHSRGLVHRDIKPANMLVGRGKRIVLTDFGIAHATFSHTSTLGEDLTTGTHESASGTPLYMSPEQFVGAWRDYGPWTDLYALGVVAWHFACGHPPFTAPSFVELGLQHMSKDLPPLDPQFDVPDSFAQWVTRMTQKDPRDRIRSAAQARDELAAGVRERSPKWRTVASRHRSRSSRGSGLGLLGMKEVPTVGRVEERDRLWEALLSSTEGLQVVHLWGAMGTGKSHMAQWCAQTAVECGFSTTYRVDEGAEDDLTGVSGLLHAVYRSAGLPLPKLLDRVETFGIDHRIDVDPRFVVDAMTSTGSLSADQAFEPLARVLRGLARRDHLVLWFDDVQPDGELARLTEFLQESHSDLPAIIVTTSVHGLEQSRASHQIELGFMTDVQVEEILRSQVDLGRRVLDETLSRCGGSPLFAVQLLEDWVRSGQLRPDVGLDTDSSTLAAALPEDVAELWRRSLAAFVADLAGVRALSSDRLRVATSPELVQGRLEAAAVLGQQVDETEWDAVAEAHGLRRVPFLIDELVRHRLATRTATGFRFVHRLLRDVLVEQAKSAHTLVGLNHAAALVVAKLYPEGSAHVQLRLARHLTAAHESTRALELARDAADRAREAFDIVTLDEAARVWAEAADDAKLSVSDPRRVDLRTMQAYALLLRSSEEDRNEARELLDAAARQASVSDDADLRLRVAARRAVAALYLGDIGARAAELATALDAPDGSDPARFEAQIALARAFAASGDAHKMLLAGRRAAVHGSTEAQRMQVCQLVGRALLELGELDEARRETAEGNALARQHNWVIAEARGYETLAFIADARGDFTDAANWHREALALFEMVAPRTSYPDKQREYLARALLAAGQPERAAEHLLSVRIGLESGRVGFYTHLEDAELAVAAAAGDWARCYAVVAAALTFEQFEPYEIHLRALALALLHARRGGNEQLADQIDRGLRRLTPDRADIELEAARVLLRADG